MSTQKLMNSRQIHQRTTIQRLFSTQINYFESTMLRHVTKLLVTKSIDNSKTVNPSKSIISSFQTFGIRIPVNVTSSTTKATDNKTYLAILLPLLVMLIVMVSFVVLMWKRKR